MKNISTEFKRALFYNQRDYIAFANITLVNGTVLNLTNDEIWQGGYSREDAISEDENFTVLGSAIINSATLIINNINNKFSQYTFENATVKLTEAMQFNENGSTRIERLKAGTYTVDSTNYNGATIRLSLIDNMSKFDRPYSESSLVYPASCVTIIRDACSVCGVQLNNFESALKNLSIANPPEKDGTTFREVISWVATICGCYARCNIDGGLDLQWIDTELLQSTFDGIDGGEFDTNSPHYATGDNADGELFNPWTNDNEYDGGAFSDLNNIAVIKNLSSQNICVDDTVIAGVRILVKDKSADSESDILSYIYPADYTDGFVVEISDNEFITTNNVQPILNHIGQLLYGMTFRKLNVTQLSDPSIEAGDIGLVIDRKQNTYAIIVTRCTFKIGSKQTIVCGSESALNNSSARFSQATKTYLETKALMNVERNARVIALENLADALESKSGLYTTVETTESGDIFYLHDLPNLSESNVVWKMTDEGWGVTTNYNGDHPEQTVWNAGMTVDGDAIVRILSAEGINADWIDSGTIRITDGNDNVTFEADTATGAVRINATSFSLTGQSINSIVQDTVNGMDLGNVVMELDNTYQLISTDADGNYDVFPTCTTTAKVFYGTTNVTANCTFRTPVVQNLIGTWNASTKTYTVTGMTADSGTVTITALYGSYQVSKKLTVTKIKQGEDGISIVSTAVSYKASSSATTIPTGTWSDTVVSANGQYLWTRTIVTYNDGTSSTSYSVSRQGIDGTNGTNGTNGRDGTNGTSNFVHIKYSPVADPADNDMTESPDTYIGICVDTNVADPTTASSYTWTKWVGDDGANGLNGTNGSDGSSAYVHFAYATSADGQTNFSVTPFSGATYIGVRSDTTQADSTVYTDYAWSLIKGADGTSVTIASTEVRYQASDSNTTVPSGTWSSTPVSANGRYLWTRTIVNYSDGHSTTSYSISRQGIDGTNGTNGVNGVDGRDGTSNYIHIKYSPVANPADIDITESPDEYIGVCVDNNIADPTTASSYTWTKFRGSDGAQGIPGTNGTNGTNGQDGVSSYVHFAYATSADGSQNFSTTQFAGATYLGVLTDSTLADSTVYSDYAWSLIKGADGRDGADGTSVTILGSYNTLSQLQAAHPTGSAGDAYIINGDLYVWASNAWTNVGQIQGPAGRDGTDGTDGASAYVHFAYSTSSNGQQNFSVTPFDGATYIGVRSDTTQADSTVYSDYTWSLMKGADGTSVTITSTEVRYKAGTSATTAPTGTWSSTIPSVAGGSYLWTRTIVNYSDGTRTTSYSVARQGINGTNGTNGINGTDGRDGTSNYVHIKYSAVANPSDAQMTENPSDYIGICVDTNAADPSTASSYTWSRWTGEDGSNGINGTNGTDGTSAYVHFAYASSADGQTGFSTSYFSGAAYIGVRSDTTQADSTNYRDYTWSKIKGDNGTSVTITSTSVRYQSGTSATTAPTGTWQSSIPSVAGGNYLWTRTIVNYSDGTSTTSYSVARQGINGTNGTNGINGTNGTNGTSSYVHIKYSAVANPTSAQMTETPSDYIGLCIDNNEADPTTSGSYTWTRWTGVDGTNGINGTNGTDGTPAYVHFAYAKSADGSQNFSNVYFDGAVYIGVRSDASVADSTNYRDYTWSKMRGDDGRGVVSITEYYGISNSTSTQPSSWSTSVVNPTASNRYLWNYNTTSYTSGNPSSTDPRIIGMYSADGASGRGISSITEYYQVSSSSTTAPTSWSTSMVNTTTTNKYLWNYEKITYTDGSESSSTPRIIGTHGATGTSARTYLLEVSPKSTKMTQANVYSPNQITIKSYYRDGTSTNKTAYSATYRVDVCVGNTWYENICSLTSRTSAILELRYDAQASTPYDYYDSGAAPDPTDTFDMCAVLSPGSTSVRVRMLNGSTLLDQEEIALLSDATAVVLDQESVFNALTNNGQDQGIFLNASDHKIYINSSYIATGRMKVGGANNSNGTIRVLDANNNLIGGINNTEIYHKNTSNDKVSMNSGGLFFYRNTSTQIGEISRDGNKLYIAGTNGMYIEAGGEIEIFCYDSNSVYYGIHVLKSNTTPVTIGNGANLGSVKIPTSINSDGTVASWQNVRITGGVVYAS